MTNPYAPPATPTSVGHDAPYPSVTLLRVLVVASTTIYTLLVTWPLLPVPLSDVSLQLLPYRGAGALLPGLAELTAWIAMPLWFIAAIGLFLTRAWGRGLFVGLYVWVLAQGLIGGMSIRPAAEDFLITFVSMIDGAIIALSYTRPLADRFARRRKS